MTEIEAYCRIMSYDYMKRQDLLYYIERLDNEYMNYIDERREEDKNKKPSKG